MIRTPSCTDRVTPARRWIARVLVVAMSLPTLPAFAAPPVAADNRTQVELTPNGVPLVDIARANAAGVSHNRYQRFDVDRQGLILNNSTEVQRSLLAATVRENANLQGQAATVILNEVVSANRSQLNGYIEIHGRAAELVIANPYGITCNGCGFINTPRVTLSTGLPVFEQDGRLGGFQVRQGDILVGADGLDASEAAYFDLLTRSLRVDGPIWAQALAATTGRFDQTYAGRVTTVDSSVSSDVPPTVSIDVAALGGMYANRIRLMSTERGVGVTVRGDMAATVDDVVIDTAGRLTLSGRVSAAGDIALQADGPVATGRSGATGNDAFVFAGRALDIASDDALELGDGLLGGEASMTLSGTRLDDAGAGTADRYSGGDIRVTVAGSATLDAARWDAGAGLALQAGDALRLGQAQLTSRGSGSALALGAATVDLSVSRLRAVNDVTVAAAGTLTLAAGSEAGVAAGRDVSLSAGTAITLSGGVEAGRDIVIDTAALTGRTGSWLYAGRDLTVEATGATQQAGAQWSAGATARLRGQTLAFAGETVARAVDADALSSLTLGADALVYGVDDIALAADSLILLAGTVYAGRDAALTGRGAFNDSAAGLRVAGRAMTVSAGQDLLLAAGQRYDAGTSLSVSAGRDLVLGGSADPAVDGVLLSSGGSMTLAAGRDLTVARNGLAVSDGDLLADAARRLVLAPHDSTAGVQNYALGAGGNVVLRFTELGQDEIFAGAVAVGGDLQFVQRAAGRGMTFLRFANGSRLDVGGTVRAERDDFNSGSAFEIYLDAGATWIANAFDLELARLDIQNGAVFRGGSGQSSLRLNQLCSTGIFSADCSQFAGTLTGSARTQLDIYGDFTNAGRISNAEVGDPAAGSSLAISTSGSFTNTAGGFVGGSDRLTVAVTDGATLRNDGLMYSSGNMTLTGGSGALIVNGAGATLLMGSARAGTADNTSLIGGVDAAAATRTFRNHGKVEAVGQTLLIQVGTFINAFETRPATDFIFLGETWQICPDRLANCRFTGNAYADPATVFYRRPLETGDPLSASPTWDRDDQIGWNADLRGDRSNQDSGFFPVYSGGIEDYYAGQKAYFVQDLGEVRQDWYVVHRYEEGLRDPAAVAAATPAITVESGNLTVRTDAGRNEAGLLSSTDTLTITGLSNAAVSSFSNTSLEMATHTYRREVIRKYTCHTDGLVGSVCDKLNWLGKSSYLTGYTDTDWTGFVRLDDSYSTGVSGTVKARDLVATVGNFTNTGTGGGISAVSPVIDGAIGARGLDAPDRQQVQASGPAQSSLQLPTGANGRYVQASDPSAGYLVETNPLLVSFDNPYLGSDYLMAQLGLKPENYLLRFGDAAYEARLIREQVQAQTGVALLRTAYSDYEQQAILMDSAVAEAKRLQLNLGTALTAEQIASLKQDIVWMVATEVAGKTVLVPVVYLTDATRAAGSTSQVLAERAMITADSFTNRGGEINANARLQVVSRGDLNNIGGLIGGGNVSLKSLTGNINNITETKRIGDSRNYYTVAGPRGGIVASGNLLLDAKQDINITGADVVADGRAALVAGRDVNVSALVLETRMEHATEGRGVLNRTASSERVTTLSASGARVAGGQGVLLDAGRNVDVLGADVDGGQGVAALRAREGDVTIRSIDLVTTASGSSEREGFFAEATSNGTSDARKGTPFSASGFSGYEKSTSSFESSSTANAGSRVGGKGVAVLATKGSVTLQGSDIEAGEDGALISAGKDVNIIAAYDSTQSKSSSEQHRFGISADASTEGVMGGLKTQGGTLQTEDSSRTARTSSITSAGGISVTAGGTLKREGAQFDAKGDIGFEADRIEDIAARNETSSSYSGRTYEAGISAGVTTGLGSTVGGIASGEVKQVNISSPQSQVVIGGSGSSYSGGDGSSTAVVTRIRAGGSVTVKANKDIVEEGTRYSAGGDVDIAAQSYENRAAANTRRSATDTSSASSSLTVAVNAASEASATLTAAGANEKENSASSQAVVGGFEAGRNVSVRTDRDLRLEGANVKAGGGVRLAAGGDLKLDQANDTGSASSSSKSGGATLSVSACLDLTCVGGSVAANARTGEGQENSQTGRAVNIQSGGASSLSAGNDMRLQGTNVKAGGDIALSAGGDIDFQALSSSTSRTGRADGAGVQAGLNVGKSMNLAKDGGGSASVDFERVRENETTDTRRGGTLQSGGQLSITSGGDTRLEGTQASARSARVNVGGNLLMESAQSTEKEDTKNVAGGLSVSGGRNVGSGTGDAAGAGSNAASSGSGGKSFGFSAKADVDLRDKDNLTNQNALIQTTGGTELIVGGNATLAGANIRAGGGVSGEIGGTLNVETRTDRVKESATRVDAYVGLSSVNVGGDKKEGGEAPKMNAGDRFDRTQGKAIDTLNHAGSTGVMLKAESSGTDSQTVSQRSGMDGGAVGLGGLTVKQGANFVGAAPGSDGMKIEGTVTRSDVTTYTRNAPAVSIDVRGTVASALGSDEAQGGTISGNLVKGSNIFRDPDNMVVRNRVSGREDAPDTPGTPIARRAVDDLPPGGVRRKDPEPLPAPPPLKAPPTADAPTTRPRAGAVGEADGPRAPAMADRDTPALRPRADAGAPPVVRPVPGADAAAPRPRSGNASDAPVRPSPSDDVVATVARPRSESGPVPRPVPAAGDDIAVVRPRSASGGDDAPRPGTTAQPGDDIQGVRRPVVGNDDASTRPRAPSVSGDGVPGGERIAMLAPTSGSGVQPGYDVVPAYDARLAQDERVDVRGSVRSPPAGTADGPEVPRAVLPALAAGDTDALSAASRPRAGSTDDGERIGYSLAYDDVRKLPGEAGSYAATAYGAADPYTTATYPATDPYAAVDALYGGAAGAAPAPPVSEAQLRADQVQPTFLPPRDLPNGLQLRELPAEFRGEQDGQAEKQVKVGQKVIYFGDDDRRFLELAVDPQTGRLYRASDPTRAPVDLVGEGTVMPIFVMDGQGRIYAYPKPRSGEIHHSSLAGGQPVALAGQLVVKDGYITHIDNMSGHYQPTVRQLDLARTFLERKLGANLGLAARVGVMEAWVRDEASGQFKRKAKLVDLDQALRAGTQSEPERPFEGMPRSSASGPAGTPRRRNRAAERGADRRFRPNPRRAGCAGHGRLTRRLAPQRAAC